MENQGTVAVFQTGQEIYHFQKYQGRHWIAAGF
jgi:hypothetical protein